MSRLFWHIAHTSTILLVLCSLVAPPLFLAATPRTAHAQVGLVACISQVLGFTSGGVGAAAAAPAVAAAAAGVGGTVPVSTLFDPNTTAIQLNSGAQTALSGTTAGNTTSLTMKECFIDPLMWQVKEVVISSLTASVVDWINSGFEGWPTFIDDPAGFFRDLGDQIAGEFITAGGLEFLCSPFQLDIQIDLILRHFSPARGSGGRLACRLSEVMDNIDDFIAGNFADGGWPGFFNVALVPQNNPYGAFFMADAAMTAHISSATGRERMELDWGNGFRSIKCDADDDPLTPDQICTPGTWIQNQLDDWTGAPLRQLEIADELDEIIGALMQYLVREIMSGAGGLLGTSKSRAYSNTSATTYTSRLRSQANTANSAASRKTSLLDRINALIAAENAIPRDVFIPFLENLRIRVNAVDTTQTSAAIYEFGRIEYDLHDLEEAIRMGLVPGPALPGTPPAPPTAAP